MKSKSIEFITLAEVIEIHQDQISLYGGNNGIRDINLLSSALAIPQATFDGEYLYKDLFEMAAAYGYHICQNHPFIDGNKRVGLVTALVFLEFNGIDIDDIKEELYDMMINISSNKKGKKNFEELLRKLSLKKSRGQNGI